MKIGNKLFWVLLLSAIVCSLEAQTSAQTPTDLPKILPPNPTAAAFARYGEVPVDISTGVPQIEIPLYTIKSRQLEVPLSLSYHAAGIKVNDISTPIGLGWSLKGMGLVSRTIIDRPDEEISNLGIGGKAQYSSYQRYNDAVAALQPNWASYEALGEILYKDYRQKDKQADRFNYELPGKGGSTFRYDFNTGNLVILPYKPVKIAKGFDYYNVMTSFTIINETGTQYIYDQPYSTQQSNWSTQSYNYNQANTSWYLTKIISADGNDQIKYKYKSYTNDYELGYFSHSSSWGIMETRSGAEGAWINPTLSLDNQNVNFITTHEALLDSIITVSTIVTFHYANDRKDWKYAPYRLDAIEIYDKLYNKLVKKIILNNNTYFGGTCYDDGGAYDKEDFNYRLKLSSVTIMPTDGGLLGQTYSIDYDKSYMPPYNSFERNLSLKKMFFDEDWWGYYNGANSPGLVPLEFLFQIAGNDVAWRSNYGGVRRPNHNFAKACLIQSIKYPTGGITSFEFEPNFANSVYSPNDSSYIGGFRIKKINSAINKTYNYSNGIIPYLINHDLFTFGQIYDWDYNPCFFGPPTSWPVSGTASRYTAQSSSFCSLTFSSGAPILYTSVNEYSGTSLENTGKTEYNFAVPDDPMPEDWSRLYGSNWYDNGAYEPKLISKVNYKHENGIYLPVSATLNTFQTFRNKEYSTGVNVVKTSYDINSQCGYYDYGYLFQNYGCPIVTQPYVHHFSYIDTKASEKVSLLTQTEERAYNPNGIDYLFNTTSYTYDTINLQPKLKVSTNSKGDTIRSQFKYPIDFVLQYPYYYMIEQNVLTPVIEQKSYKGADNSHPLEYVKTNYNGYTGLVNNFVALETIETSIGTNNPEVRLRYIDYDKVGNVLSVSKENDVYYTYLWGYNKMYPVAQIEGVDYGSVSTVVNQTILDNPPSDDALRAELQKLRNTLQNIQVSSFTYRPLVGMTSKTDPNGKTTYYDYDGFGRLTTVRDSKTNIQRQIGYSYKGQPENPVPGAFYNAAIDTWLNKNNCETGYTGAPILYSVPAYRYYSSDNQVTADQLAQNDVLTNGQDFANQNSTCIPAYINKNQSGTFFRNDCGIGFITGRAIDYTVLSGTYRATTQAAADQLALDNVIANGQNYANLHGICYNSSLPFVKIEMTNWHQEANGNQYEDIDVNFYSDFACTIPKTVSNLNITIQYEFYSSNANSTTLTPQNYIVSGSSAVLISGVMVFGSENGDNVEKYYTIVSGDEYNLP